MVKITGIEIYPLQADFKKPFSFSGITRLSSNNVILTITADQGACGWGEACPVPGMSGETAASICAVLKDYFAPLLIGQDPLDIAVLTRRVENSVNGNICAKSGVNIALYDLVGKLLCVPVYTLLGGKHRDEIEVNGSIGIGTAAEMLAACEEQMAECGVRYLKLYCGKESVAQDVRKLKEVIGGIGGQAQVFLDVNQQWSPKEAIKAIRSLEEEGLLFVEQPTPKWDLEGMRQVCQAVTTPIAADEAVFAVTDITRLAMAQACDMIAVYAMKPGGISGGHEAAILAQAAGMDCFIGSYLELGVATAAGIHLAATIPDLKYPCYMYGPMKYSQDVLQQPLQVHRGKVAVPEGPGLGIDVDMERLLAMRL